MIKALIVENEPVVAQILETKLARLFKDIQIVAKADSVASAEAAILEHKPDIAFLDVELNNGETTFDLLSKLPKVDFEIVFTTAYNQYAIQAIKCGLIDYLLKPIDDDELTLAIEKFRLKRSTTARPQIDSLLGAWARPGNQQNNIALPTMEGYEFVTVGDIVYCEAESSQTMLAMADKKKKMISRTLKECEELLQPFGFFRIHKSYLINMDRIRKYVDGKDGTVLMSDGAELTVSRNVKPEFLQRLRKP